MYARKIQLPLKDGQVSLTSISLSSLTVSVVPHCQSGEGLSSGLVRFRGFKGGGGGSRSEKDFFGEIRH